MTGSEDMANAGGWDDEALEILADLDAANEHYMLVNVELRDLLEEAVTREVGLEKRVEALVAEMDTLRVELDAARADNAGLRIEVADLRAQLGTRRRRAHCAPQHQADAGGGAVPLALCRASDGLMAEQFPVYIPTRDRLAPLLELLAWLESVGQHEVYLVDNRSSYRPLLDYFERSPYHVIHVGHNLGHRSPFLTGVVQRSVNDRFFVVSDPDVVPDEGCPADALAHFRELLDEFPEADKVGFGLRIDDLPEHFDLRDDVVRWEEQFWQDEVKPGVFRAQIDTTFAMYRPLARRHEIGRSLRTGPPYVARARAVVPRQFEPR